MGTRARILIAEDDGLMRDLVRVRLETAGYETHTARTGREAIDRIYRVRPDALILDINLPEIDGFGVLAALQTDLPEIAVPTLMLTGRKGSDDVHRAVALGAKDYLTKDLVQNQLLPRLARLLKSAAPDEAMQTSRSSLRA